MQANPAALGSCAERAVGAIGIKPTELCALHHQLILVPGRFSTTARQASSFDKIKCADMLGSCELGRFRAASSTEPTPPAAGSLEPSLVHSTRQLCECDWWPKTARCSLFNQSCSCQDEICSGPRISDLQNREDGLEWVRFMNSVCLRACIE